jgi:osmotically-inducible protein OsmY
MESDTSIRQDVLEELQFDPRIDAAGIGVAVKNGIVTLSGHIPNYGQKLAAARAAQRVRGVRGVAQDLVVRLRTDDKLDDDEIAERVLNVLKWSVGSSRNIKVLVDDARVTLTGDVPWDYQRVEAERVIRDLTGVISVSNKIVVRPKVEPTAVADSIAKAFARSAHIDSQGITVTVDGTTVTLAGKVSTYHEKKVAAEAAWAVAGVTAVHDNLVI